jgi:hypothetical protein
MESQAPVLPELGGVPALPPFPQEAPKEHPTKREGAALDIWIIEGTDNLDDAGIRHKNAFYALLKEWFLGRDFTCTLLTKRKYDEILKFCLDLINSADCRSLYIAGNKQAYKWAAKYDAIVVGKESAVLVLRPTKSPIPDAQSTCLDALQQPTYFERLFSDLLKIHHVDHCKAWLIKLPTCWRHVAMTAKCWHILSKCACRGDTILISTHFLCWDLPTSTKFSSIVCKLHT